MNPSFTASLNEELQAEDAAANQWRTELIVLPGWLCY